MVGPDEHRVEPDRHRRERDRRVAEDRLPREDGDDLGDDPHRGQDHDVDLGVPEEPEHVLEEHGVAALLREEEVRSHLAVEQEHRQPGRERGQHDDEQRRVDLHRPDEQRHPHPGHPRRAHVVDRDQEVDRARERGDGQDVERQDPEVDPVARREGRLGQRRVAGPAALGRAARGEPARVQDDPAEQEEPVGERVQAREGHVARADHERHEVVAEAREDRDDDEEDHRRPVHGEELVVGVLGDEVLVRRGELGPHQQRQDAAEPEEGEARDDVEDPDPLVVDGRQPARDRAARDDDRGGWPLCPSRHCRLPVRSAGSGTRRAPRTASRASPCPPPASGRRRFAAASPEPHGP